MRKRQAYLTILLALFAGTTLTVAACAPDTTAPAVEETTATDSSAALNRLVREYGWVGGYHNDGLAHVYGELSRQSNPGTTLSDLCRIAAEATRDFHRRTLRQDVPPEAPQAIFTGECLPPDDGGKFPTMNLEVPADHWSYSGYTVYGQPITSSPQRFGIFADRVINAIAGSTSKAAMVSELHNVHMSAIGQLTFDEAGGIVAMISVAISSAEYWEENLHTWGGLQGPGIRYSIFGNAPQPTPVDNRLPLIPRPAWWYHPYVQPFKRVVIADARAAAVSVLKSLIQSSRVNVADLATSALHGSANEAIHLLK